MLSTRIIFYLLVSLIKIWMHNAVCDVRVAEMYFAGRCYLVVDVYKY